MKMDLNDRQMAVLRWIGEGCPEGVMQGEGYKISAAALRARELVRTSGHGDRWRAEITDRGRAYLAEPPPRQRARRTGRVGEAQSLSKTEQLVADVVAAGGVLTLPDETAAGGVNWRQRAYAAQRAGKLPAGKHLTVSSAKEGFVISLEDGATGNELGAEDVPVPARIGRYHRVAGDFRDRTGLHEVSRKALPRASRIIHALATELERRGHDVRCVTLDQSQDRYERSGWKPKHDGQLVVSINGHSNRVRLWEKGVGLRAIWERAKEHWERDRLSPRFGLYMSRPVAYDAGASGELNLAVLGHSSRQTGWGDRKRWRVEARLPQLLRELEAQAVEAEQARLRREREEAERQRQWEAAIEDAKRRLVVDHRHAVLRERVDRWHEAEGIRSYCEAVEAKHGQAFAADSEAAEWLAFARAHADRLQALPRMPPDPEIAPEALKPYLGRWSPYGPTGW